jgi:hypothetical protein
MKNYRRSMIAVSCVTLLATACVRARDEALGGKWFIRWEMSQIPGSGGTHPFLCRRPGLGTKRVEENTWRYRYLGDDCVLYVAGNSTRGELMAACGDHQPVVIAPGMDDYVKGETADGGLKGDPILINGTPMAVSEIKLKAGRGKL